MKETKNQHNHKIHLPADPFRRGDTERAMMLIGGDNHGSGLAGGFERAIAHARAYEHSTTGTATAI